MKKVQSTSFSLTEADIAKLIIRMKVVFPTPDEVRQIVQEEIKLLPTKEEFFKRMDELMGEVKAMRETQELHSADHTRINDRLDKHDQQLGISTAI